MRMPLIWITRIARRSCEEFVGKIRKTAPALSSRSADRPGRCPRPPRPSRPVTSEVLVQLGQALLPLPVALGRGGAVPLDRLGPVLLDALALLVGDAQGVHRVDVAGLRRLAEPL